MNPSASNTALLLQCSRPFAEGIPIDRGPVSEAAKYGLAWHDVAAKASPGMVLSKKVPKIKRLQPLIVKATKAFEIPHLMNELEAHLFASLPVLLEWILSIPIPKGETMEILVEQSFALNPSTQGVRSIENPTVDDHIYVVRPGEVPGTLDLALLIGTRKRISKIYLVDHKTGEGDFSRPDRLEQILTLALMLDGFLAKRVTDRTILTAGVFHAFRRGIAKMYEDEIALNDLLRHSSLLAKANKRIGDGTMRPGKECKRCPARTGCPAGDSELLLKAENLLTRSNIMGSQLLLTSNDQTISKERKLGLLYEVIKNGMELAERGREAIKAEMVQGAMPELADGKILILAERAVERLSKKNFVETYGKLGAERMFEKWRKDGALMKKGETYMRPVDD